MPAALAIARGRFPGRDAIAAFLVSPLMIPHVVLGVALLRFFSGLGLAGSFAGLVAAHLIVVTPYMVRLVTAGLAGLDPRVERAAESLGAGRLTVFRRITLPLILPGVIAGMILAFAKAMGEFGATITFVSNIPGETQTLSSAIYGLMQVPGGEAGIWRLAAVAVAISLAALLFSEWLVRRHPTRHGEDG